MIRCVIFDLDGVIVNTDNFHFNAWKKMADDKGIPFDEEINNRLRGVSRLESLEIILEKSVISYSNEEKVEMAFAKNEMYVKSLDTLTSNDILPGIMNLLRKLKVKGIKVAIGSSSKNAKKILLKIGLLEWFDCISDGTNITNSKPHPEVFIKAADMLDIPYEECVVVEDAHSGIEAAKRANMVAFATGDAKTCESKDYDLEELLDYIKGENNE